MSRLRRVHTNTIDDYVDGPPKKPRQAVGSGCVSDAIPRMGATLDNFRAASALPRMTQRSQGAMAVLAGPSHEMNFFQFIREIQPALGAGARQVHPEDDPSFEKREAMAQRAGPLRNAGFFRFMRELALVLHDTKLVEDEKERDRARMSLMTSAQLACVGDGLGSKVYYRYRDALKTIFADIPCAIDVAIEAIQRENEHLCELVGIDPSQPVAPYTCFSEVEPMDEPIVVPAPVAIESENPVVRQLTERGNSLVDARAQLRPGLRDPSEYKEGPLAKEFQNNYKMLRPLVRKHVPEFSHLNPIVDALGKLLESDPLLRFAFEIYTSVEFPRARAAWLRPVPTSDGELVYRGMQALLDAMPPLDRPLVVYRGVWSGRVSVENDYIISTSLSFHRALAFAGSGTGTILEIFIQTGSRVLPTFAFSDINEQEITLHHNAWTVRPVDGEYIPFPRGATSVPSELIRTIYVPPDQRKRRGDQLADSCQRVEKAYMEWYMYHNRTALGRYVNIPGDRTSDRLVQLIQMAYRNGGFLPA